MKTWVRWMGRIAGDMLFHGGYVTSPAMLVGARPAEAGAPRVGSSMLVAIRAGRGSLLVRKTQDPRLPASRAVSVPDDEDRRRRPPGTA